MAVEFFLAAFLFLFIWISHKRRISTEQPKQYPLLGNLIEFLRNRGRFLEWSTEYLIKAPGNTITMKRPGDKSFKITANPANVEHILKTNFDNYPKGEHISINLSDLLGQGIFNADFQLWKVQRKLASYEFTTRSLRDYLMESLAEEIQSRLIPTMTSLCESGTEVDFQDLLLRFSFDNICKLAFGVDPVCLDPSFPRVKFAEAFDAATSLSTARFYMLHKNVWKIMKVLNIGSEKKLKQAMATVDEFADSVIRSRRKSMLENDANGTEYADLLSRFMNMRQDSNPGASFSDKFVRDIIINFVLAGRDTTAVTLSWFFWLVSRHPVVEAKLLDEFKTVSVKQQQVVFTYEQLGRMEYLQACLYESLRLYPAVPVDTKVAKDEDVWPDGTRVEKGMRVTYHIYAMGRMESLWGKDCGEFRPERWLKVGHFVAENPYKFPVFQAGPRVCLGKELAMLQMKSVVAALLPMFKLVIAADFEPRYKLNMTMPMERLPVVPKIR